MRQPRVSMIAAVSDDGFIAVDGRIPWRLPADIAHFRTRAAGQWLLLGRKTHEQMAGWFTDHHPLVLTRNRSLILTEGRTVISVGEALACAQEQGAEELLVCGGGEVYAAALPLATRLILTCVHTTLGRGTAFPQWNRDQWRENILLTHPADAGHSHAFTISEWERLE